MKKIIFISLLFFCLISSLFCQEEKRIKLNVPSFNVDGVIEETPYVSDYPANYSDAIKMIDLLIEIYDDVSKNYKEQLEELIAYSNKISKELEVAKERNDTLSNMTNTENEKKKSNNAINSFGVLFDYGIIDNSSEFSFLFGLKLYKVTLTFGPEFLIPNNEFINTKLGFKTSIGYWF